MKIRTGFVSNSSSSSFIICGNNIKKQLTELCTIKLGNDTQSPYMYDDYFEHSITYNDHKIVDDVLQQIEQYNIDQKELDRVINDLIYGGLEEYLDFAQTKRHVSYDDSTSGDMSLFECPDSIKKIIDERIKNRTSKLYSWDIGLYNIDISNHVQFIKERLLTKYSEVFVLSYGDNHGWTWGSFGGYMEQCYIMNHLRNLVTNIQEIYKLNEH